MKIVCRHRIIRRLATARDAVASIEFALNGLLLFLFLFVIINLGYLALVLGTMKHSVQEAARTAAVQTGVQIASGTTNKCVTSAQVAGFFTADASPILPPASVNTVPGAPTVLATWINNAAGNILQGTYVTVTATYLWAPIGIPGAIPGGLPLNATATQMVGGTSGTETTGCS
jgi:hypothetical protein